MWIQNTLNMTEKLDKIDIDGDEKGAVIHKYNPLDKDDIRWRCPEIYINGDEEEVAVHKHDPMDMEDVSICLPAEILYLIFDHLAPKEMMAVVQV